MRHRLRTAIVAFPLLLFPALGWVQAPEQLTLQPSSRVWVEGTSSMRNFTCKLPGVSAVVETTGANPVPQLLTGNRTVKSVDVTIPGDRIDCANGTMDEHAKLALKVKDFSRIQFTVTAYDVNRTPQGASGTLNGTLMLGGVRKPVAIAATATSDHGMLHVVGSYDMKMTDFNLTPPTLMFGRVTVGDAVTVRFDLLLKS